ncbi:MAG: FRG domain-containing protein [Lachnospiraceae bacterium]|nr:FRG domain-containing protein [Lachnospiraceae bacterium]
MITERIITDLDGLLPLLSEQDYRADLRRNRSRYVYRGMLDSSFKMTTSLHRNCGDLERNLERAILENFAKYAMVSDPSVNSSVWRTMIMGQHYGLPTRLLDWTHSPLVGLHFATCEPDLSEMEDHDCMVWRIDMAEIQSLLPRDYQDVVNERSSTYFTVDMLSAITGNRLEKYDEDMHDSAMVIVEPPSMDVRIVNQYSFFSIIPMDMTDIEEFLDKHTDNTVKYVIDRKLRWRVRDMLDQINVSERIVYPGLSGLSRWIARHYYVKV